MRTKNRLSPYPILDNYGDDYINSSFSADYDVKTQFAEVYGKISFQLQNKEIEQLIINKKAVYLIHIECPSTCYRNIVSSFESEIEFKIDSRYLAKVIEIRTFIVLTENVDGFMSENFHPDYSGQRFDLLAHQIIGVGTAYDFDVSNDDRDLESLPSVIQIVELKDTRKGSVSVNTDNDDHVIVGLAPEVFTKYAHLGKNVFKATSFSLVLLPALLIVLQRMITNKDDADMNLRHWFQVIEKMLLKNGFSLDDISADNDSLLSVCQSMFADPISRSFTELSLYSERCE